MDRRAAASRVGLAQVLESTPIITEIVPSSPSSMNAQTGAAATGRHGVAAQAQPNIALIKYWGKRDTALNLPVVGSISITLDALWTRTRVGFA